MELNLENQREAHLARPKKTTPYKFYQYWINSSDEDVVNYIKIFSLKSKKEIETLILRHEEIVTKVTAE